jgi:1-acylglycerone phosphate reductase
MAMTRSFIELLIPTRGLIINVASISALVPYVFGSVYASSKAAVVSYSRTLRQELRPFGVRVQVVMAGAVQSNISANTAKTRVLPEESLYARVRHLYERRQGYSQSKASGSLPTAVFAREVVDRALAAEVAPFWRSWFGRPDWLYYGGMTRLLWWGSVLGEWVTDLGAWRTFGLHELEAMVEMEATAVKGGRKLQ